ncbi:hypothetical protein ABBQ32_003262 [Trebouxia sp. C0010 RCD-2024]
MAARPVPAPLGAAPLLTAVGKSAQPHRPPTVAAQAEKRAAPVSGSNTPHKAKKQRISSNLECSQAGLKDGLDADTVVLPEIVGLSSVRNHSKPCRMVPEQNQSKPRRVVPEQILPVPSPRPAGVHSKQNLTPEVAPTGLVHGVQHRMGSSGCMGQGQSSPKASSWQKPWRPNSPKTDSHTAAAVLGEEAEECCSQAEDSSYDGSEEGSEEAPQLEEGVDEGSEGVPPSKLLVEFGASGDAWWQDFIAAKEQMLNDVLQAIP